MKKILAIILAVVMLFALVACGKASGSDPAGESSGEQSEGSGEASESAPETEEATGFPKTYTPKWSTADAATEFDTNKGYQIGYGDVAYDPTVEITLEYIKAEDILFTALNGASDWPAELDDEWQSYGYTAIKTDDNISARTLAVGQYGSKQALIVKQYDDAISASKIHVDPLCIGFPDEEGLRYVPYCMLIAEGEVTDEELMKAAHDALYLQAWLLVSAADQGVVITANDQVYTLDEILALAA